LDSELREKLKLLKNYLRPPSSLSKCKTPSGKTPENNIFLFFKIITGHCRALDYKHKQKSVFETIRDSDI